MLCETFKVQCVSIKKAFFVQLVNSSQWPMLIKRLIIFTLSKMKKKVNQNCMMLHDVAFDCPFRQFRYFSWRWLAWFKTSIWSYLILSLQFHCHLIFFFCSFVFFLFENGVERNILWCVRPNTDANIKILNFYSTTLTMTTTTTYLCPITRNFVTFLLST